MYKEYINVYFIKVPLIFQFKDIIYSFWVINLIYFTKFDIIIIKKKKSN